MIFKLTDDLFYLLHILQKLIASGIKAIKQKHYLNVN